MKTETSAEVTEVDQQLKFKSHQRMQVEFISNNVDVMTHDCLSNVALAVDVMTHDFLSSVALALVCVKPRIALGASLMLVQFYK